MASVSVGESVQVGADVAGKLVFPPPETMLHIACHPLALNAPHVPHTQVAAFGPSGLVWVGGMGEDLLVRTSTPPRPTARVDLSRHILAGSRLWEIVRPGALLAPGVPHPLSTIYDGSPARPWVILGETAAGDLVAAPLNETRNPRWFTPVISQHNMSFPGNEKDSQVEVAHLWSLPASTPAVGNVLAAGVEEVEAKVRKEYSLS